MNSPFNNTFSPLRNFQHRLNDFVRPAASLQPDPQSAAEHSKSGQLGKLSSNTVFAALKPVNVADFSPQSVADRVIDFVSRAIAQRAGSESEAEEMLEQARQGVTQGIADARGILETSGKLSEEVDNLINETAALINKGLDELAQPATETTDLSNTGQLLSSAASINSQLKQSSEASIEIVTQDGDRVEINYSSFIQSASSQSYYVDSQISASRYELNAESSVAFQFSVQGELDQGEQQAINELLSEVGDIANSFFSGDVQAAFNSALELGINAQELKSYTVDLQQSSSIKVVETYQQTEQLTRPENNPAETASTGPARAIDVLSQLEQLLDNLQANSIIEQPDTMVKSLLTDMFEMLSEEFQYPIKSYIEDAVESL